MGGSRHSKNAGTMGSESQTYYERQALGYGTVRERLGKDPVATPHGIIFSREAILENLLAQKKAIRRKLALWEAQQAGTTRKADEREQIEAQAQLLAFDRQNHSGASDALAANLKNAIREEAEELLSEKRVISGAINIRTNKDKMKALKSFWLPSLAPESKIMVDKPDAATICPATGKKLRLKDLTPVQVLIICIENPSDVEQEAIALRQADEVKFTPVREGETDGRYCDPVTGTTLTNSSKLVLIKPTGDVVLKDTYERCIKPEGAYSGHKLRKGDVLDLQGGGTGFAAHDGDRVMASHHWTLGPGSGKQDLRGQHQGVRSAGGLAFMN